MTTPSGTPLTGVPDLGREGSLPPEPGWGTGPASLKNTPQRAQGLVVVDVCGAQGCHHRCPRVPTCGKKTRPCRRPAHCLVLPSPSPPTFTAGEAELREVNRIMGQLGEHRGALGCSRERPEIPLSVFIRPAQNSVDLPRHQPPQLGKTPEFRFG